MRKRKFLPSKMLVLGVISLSILLQPVQASAANATGDTRIKIWYDSMNDRELYLKLYNQVRDIPVPLQDIFNSLNWKITLEDYDFGPEYNYTQALSGVTDYGQKKIRVVATEHADRQSTIEHEFGHFIDGLYHYINSTYYSYSYTEEWQRIYNEEHANIPNSREQGYESIGYEYSPAEYFAEAFVAYLENEEELARACPQTYGFIGTLVNMYCTTDNIEELLGK